MAGGTCRTKTSTGGTWLAGTRRRARGARAEPDGWPDDSAPLLRILQGSGRCQGTPDPIPDPIPTSINIIYRSRDRFAFENHRLTLAPDPAGSGTGSASKMSSDPSDPLGSAKDEGTRRTGSASKRSPDPPDPLGFAEGWEAQRSRAPSKRSPDPPDPLGFAEGWEAQRNCAASKPSPVPRAPLGLAHDQYAGGPLRYAVKKGFVRACSYVGSKQTLIKL